MIRRYIKPKKRKEGGGEGGKEKVTKMSNSEKERDKLVQHPSKSLTCKEEKVVKVTKRKRFSHHLRTAFCAMKPRCCTKIVEGKKKIK